MIVLLLLLGWADFFFAGWDLAEFTWHGHGIDLALAGLWFGLGLYWIILAAAE